ncbi:nitric oxide synthase [Kaistia algarum]|uniref:flavodoxin domain-containing protein n=1 Tax=Kaistia algarum TaxID=2083279 RepID=UPI000CE7D07E|nr:flavodoxin domain-containing protein [Kaistia algarum]MCX5512933.1 PepSY domain-containing protein [Kaistia algarum]PPE81579.1 nitric oxide synthase [Kaistia algarum]
MSLSHVKPYLISLHRWAGLVLTPLFLMIILSGTVLSFRPILANRATSSTMGASIDVPALETLLDKLGAGGAVSSISVTGGGAAVDVASSTTAVAGTWDIATGTKSGAASSGIDVFGIAERFHKSLLLGLGLLVEAASFVMLAIMIVGPLLSCLRFRNSVIGWHRALGWCLLPVTILAPLTAVLMVLGIGGGARVALPVASHTVSVSEALTVAAPTVDLAQLQSARLFRGGTVMLQTAGENGGTFAVTDTVAVPLTGGPGLVKEIHEGIWAGAWSGALNFGISVVLLALTVTGFLSWFRRWRREGRPVGTMAGGKWLIVHASQTGTAARLAEATARVFSAAGIQAVSAPLGSLSPAALARYAKVLVIAATTGEGEIPDPARRFWRQLTPGSARGVHFAMLGLGDRSYEHFCGGAETLRSAFLAAGASEFAPFMRADRDPAPVWNDWMAKLGEIAGIEARSQVVGEDEPSKPLTLTLTDRRRLDHPEAGETQETWAIVLTSDTDLAFRPGDLLRLIPAPGQRPRSYSVGSSSRVDPRLIELTVRLHQWQEADGGSGYGEMSARLIRSLPTGEELRGRLEAHADFNPPADPSWPIVMIGAGSGVAPFPGFLAERQASGRAGPAWLFYGNRHRRADFLWQDRFETALQSGALTRLDTAFSRDPGGLRIPAQIEAAGDELRRWLKEDGAVVYICGRREMARDALTALGKVLAGPDRTSEVAAGQIEAWLAEGRIRIDAFD